MKKLLRRIPIAVKAYRYAKALRDAVAFVNSPRTGGKACSPNRMVRDAPALWKYVRLSSHIPGWTEGEEAMALALVSYSLPDAAVVVEIGSFLGRSAVLLAGARKLRNSGKVYCVDSFDATGDNYSVPFYRRIQDSLRVPLRQCFDTNIRRADLVAWVEVHQGRTSEAASRWSTSIDLLFLDADHSYEVVRAMYADWARFLRHGGIIAVHNSLSLQKDHDGSRRLVQEKIRRPEYAEICLIGSTTFARKAADVRS